MKVTGSKTMRTVFISMVAIVLCALLLVVGSYALFTDTVTVKNHLQAGTMKATLTRVQLDVTKLDENGVLKTYDPDMTPVDFTSSTEKNVFGLTGTEKIAPKTKLAATMSLSNTSDVAFTYYIKIQQTEIQAGTPSDAKLLEQLQVTVTVDGTTKSDSQTLADGVQVGAENDVIGTVKIGETATFTVTVEFLNLTNNNDAQGKQVAFDLIVYAVQAVA